MPHPILNRYSRDLPSGKLCWIGLRPERRANMVLVPQTQAIQDIGLEGDRRTLGKRGSKRQVTLINQEHIEVIASILGKDSIAPEFLRRNLVVSGINLNLLKGQRFKIGHTEFEGTEPCHPCKRMEDALGVGGFAAMYGHGGLCAKILVSGEIRVGDAVDILL